MTLQLTSINKIPKTISNFTSSHSRESDLYSLLEGLIQREIRDLGWEENGEFVVDLEDIGKVVMPFYRMGTITSLDLFNLDELIIFGFYRANRARYKNVVDAGANLGLHSVIMSLCGFNVRSYEPDPAHLRILRKNLLNNKRDNVEVIDAAVSNKPGRAQFVRVLGNTTSSHLLGAKSNAYGQLEEFEVDVVEFRPIMNWADLIKMDVEGHESKLLCSTVIEDWQGTDIMAEIGTAENAAAIFNHINSIGVRAFAQKKNWQQVKMLQDMPTSYKEGSIFFTVEKSMPWG
jgi:FkbM family methyltransferase